ncbi:MAG: hypothetical protein KDD42_05550 [Bdellovibrionales bacterium]|nr:hypothetical protein [Bdellovibrionales bacterium]
MLTRLLLLILLPSLLWAEELKIVDPSQLTRAVKNVSGKASVRVTFSTNVPQRSEVRIVNIDGIAGDILGKQERADLFVFSKVSAGVWRISPPSDVRIAQIVISEE